MTVRLLEVAQQELDEAVLHYNGESPGLGNAFLLEALAAIDARLSAAGIKHTCEEFDDNHSDIDYRMDVRLPFLYKALKA